MDLREHDNVVECIEWAPDSAIENIQKGANLDSKNKSGPFLVSGSRDKTIKVSFTVFSAKETKLFEIFGVILCRNRSKMIELQPNILFLVLGCHFWNLFIYSYWT